MLPNLRMSVLLISVLTLSMSFIPVNTPYEVNYRSQNLDVAINGTSTLHDWEMTSNKGKCEVVLVLDNNIKITGVSAINFTLPAESLKSGHSGMDNNTYKALKTSSYKNIDFIFSSAKITPLNNNTYQLNLNGKLTIAGYSRQTDVVAIAKYNAEDKSFTVTGKKDLKMTDYNVKPPTVMLGTIKTGDDISISFTSRIIR